MNFKKILSVALASCLAALAVSCGGDKSPAADPCTAHKDADANGKCDVCAVDYTCPGHADANVDGKCDTCGAPYTPSLPTETEVNYTLTVQDQDGVAIAGAELNIVRKTGAVVATVTTDANGTYSGTILSGTYTVSFKTLPEGYVGEMTSVTFEEGSTIALTVENTVPNGTANRPFLLTYETTEDGNTANTITLTLPASASHYYAIYRAGGRTMTFTNAASIEVEAQEQTYRPVNGVIEFVVDPTTDSRVPAILLIKNTSNAETTVQITVISPQGSNDNPFVMETLDGTQTATVAKESTVYYKWVATQNGFLMLHTSTELAAVYLYNTSTMNLSGTTEGAGYEYVWVNEGDEISIPVASKSTADSAEVSFTLTLTAATEQDPTVLYKTQNSFRFKSGVIYSFAFADAVGKTLTLSAENVELKVNGTAQTAANGVYTVTLAAGDVITVTNNAAKNTDTDSGLEIPRDIVFTLSEA